VRPSFCPDTTIRQYSPLILHIDRPQEKLTHSVRVVRDLLTVQVLGPYTTARDRAPRRDGHVQRSRDGRPIIESERHSVRAKLTAEVVGRTQSPNIGVAQDRVPALVGRSTGGEGSGEVVSEACDHEDGRETTTSGGFDKSFSRWHGFC